MRRELSQLVSLRAEIHPNLPINANERGNHVLQH